MTQVIVLTQVLYRCNSAPEWLQLLEVSTPHVVFSHGWLTLPPQGMDGLIIFLDSCSASDIKCDWVQYFKPAPIAPVVANILHVTNQLNPLARLHAQQLVEELQFNPTLIRSACTLMLRLKMTVADVLQEWRSHPNRQSDPLGTLRAQQI